MWWKVNAVLLVLAVILTFCGPALKYVGWVLLMTSLMFQAVNAIGKAEERKVAEITKDMTPAEAALYRETRKARKAAEAQLMNDYTRKK